MKNLFIFRAFSDALIRHCKKPYAFSLVEMLMALLVASLLLAALAPVMTRRMNENLHVTGEFSHSGSSITKEIGYRDAEYCNEIVYDDSGNELYCEGQYTVPAGFQNITVTAIGGGGGGGTAPASGYVEYGNEGGTNTFTVPAMVDELEATLISGGGGGGAGGQAVVNTPYESSVGEFTWNVPAVAKNKYIIATGCGGGGGGGGFVTANFISGAMGGLGGGGGYFSKATLASNNSYTIIVGGGGGGGASGGGSSAYVNTYVGTGDYHRGYNGTGGGGGGGGADNWNDSGSTGGLGGKNGGTGGYASGQYLGRGGERGDTTLSSNSDGNNGVTGSDSAGGTGASSGGTARWLNFKTPAGVNIPHGQGGGGGGGSATGYGGGGGGGGCGSCGGGGGGGATIFGTRSNPIFLAAGGGGGGGGTIDDYDYDAGWTPMADEKYFNGTDGNGARRHGGGGGGGGGGGTGGGNGGIGARAHVGHAGNGANASGYLASTIFGSNYCNGGTAFQDRAKSWLRNAVKGESGKPGAMRITYLDYGPGGSGGGSGQLAPLQTLTVTPNEKLSVYIGKGAAGGTAGKITSSNNINNIAVSPTKGNGGGDASAGDVIRTKILRNSNPVLITCIDYHQCGAYGGSPTGVVQGWAMDPWGSSHGGISTGDPNTRVIIAKEGFSTEDGHNAGDAEGTKTIVFGNTTFANKTTGGAGGKVVTPWFTCTPGIGGKAAGQNGSDASGYGCGGGGGYGLSNGGKGSGGYARLSWNMYWDTALDAYVSKTQGSGGGGASGNIIKETVRIKEGQVIRIRIGAGGRGARILNNTIIEAAPGGETIFGGDEFIQIRAGGGGGGGSPTVVNGKLQKGAAGKVSTICHVNSRDLHKNTSYCTRGTAGGVSPDNEDGITNGGLGAAFSYKTNDKTYIGIAGAGGASSTEYNNAKGRDAEGIGAGGGGAALLIQNKIETIDQLNFPEGGKGSPGRIILQLWE